MFISQKFKIVIIFSVILSVSVNNCLCKRNRKNFKFHTIFMEFPISKSANNSDYLSYFQPRILEDEFTKSSKENNNYLNYKDEYGIRYVEPTRKHSVEYQEAAAQNSYSMESGSIEVSTDNTLESLSNSIKFAQQVQNNDTINASTTKFPPASDSLDVNNGFYNRWKPPIPATTNIQTIPPYNPIRKPSIIFENSLHTLALKLKKLFFPYLLHEEGKSAQQQLTSLGQLLNLFRIIKFDNYPCLTARRPLTQLAGTCYHETDCARLGGNPVGTCAAGFGVCCVFKTTCNSVSDQNVTYFENPGYPFGIEKPLFCTMTVILQRNVKQILLDFLFFELYPPFNGNCVEDQFVVTGQGINAAVPTLCGINTGQHMYIDVTGAVYGKIYLSFISSNSEAKAFSIKITQLADYTAPPNCLQYHKTLNGFFSSFNYEERSRIAPIVRPSYFNNLNYAICIQRQLGFCNIIYTNEIGVGREEFFQIINLDKNGFSGPPNTAGAEIFSCPDDFVAVNFIRLCGEKLNDGSLTANFSINAPVRDFMNGPIIIPFKTNEMDVGRGFKIYYAQEKCVDFRNGNGVYNSTPSIPMAMTTNSPEIPTPIVSPEEIPTFMPTMPGMPGMPKPENPQSEMFSPKIS